MPSEPRKRPAASLCQTQQASPIPGGRRKRKKARGCFKQDACPINRCNFHPRAGWRLQRFCIFRGMVSNCFFTVWVPFRGKYVGVQRGEIPRLWVSNRGESSPVGTRFSIGKSSVLYLLRPLTLERGCCLTEHTVSGVSRIDGFCGWQATKDKEFAMSKIRLFGCSWHRKSCSNAERFSVSTGAQEVYKNPPQRRSLVLSFFPFALAVGQATFPSLADGAVHVLGEFQNFNQIDKLLHGDRIIINPHRCK